MRGRMIEIRRTKKIKDKKKNPKKQKKRTETKPIFNKC